MTIGMIGLGRMGRGIATRARAGGYDVIGYDPDTKAQQAYAQTGGTVAPGITELIAQLPTPRTVWLMVPSGAVEEVLTEITPHLSSGDCVIDGGNSFYKDSQTRAARLALQGIHLIDCGVSGGILGETEGFSIMAGGSKEGWLHVESLMRVLAGSEAGCAHVGAHGAGHFVKMVHNGVEYGMMEAIAEGFALLQASPYGDVMDMSQVAGAWNSNAIISSRLMSLTKDVLETEDMDTVAGHIAQTGGGAWTVEAAKDLGVDARVIAAALSVRSESVDPKQQTKFSNKLVAALRARFGGHDLPRIS